MKTQKNSNKNSLKYLIEMSLIKKNETTDSINLSVNSVQKVIHTF